MKAATYLKLRGLLTGPNLVTSANQAALWPLLFELCAPDQQLDIASRISMRICFHLNLNGPQRESLQGGAQQFQERLMRARCRLGLAELLINKFIVLDVPVSSHLQRFLMGR